MEIKSLLVIIAIISITGCKSPPVSHVAGDRFPGFSKVAKYNEAVYYVDFESVKRVDGDQITFKLLRVFPDSYAVFDAICHAPDQLETADGVNYSNNGTSIGASEGGPVYMHDDSLIKIIRLVSEAANKSNSQANVLTTSNDEVATAVQKSCRNFVQEFYNGGWKGTRIVKPHFQPDVSFAPALLKMLDEDANAIEKSGDEGDGLDFDPVYGGNGGPADRYTVGKITAKGDRFLAEVYGTWDGKKDERPHVIPELMLQGGKWLFVNFEYPDPEHDDTPASDLISTLRELANNRQKH